MKVGVLGDRERETLGYWGGTLIIGTKDDQNIYVRDIIMKSIILHN